MAMLVGVVNAIIAFSVRFRENLGVDRLCLSSQARRLVGVTISRSRTGKGGAYPANAVNVVKRCSQF